MDGTGPEERLSRRGRRALPLIVVALLVIAGTSLAYVHPSWPSASNGPAVANPTPSPPLLSDQYLVVYDFLTSTSGWAMVEAASMTAPRFWVFKTTDAAKHWQQQLAGSLSSATPGQPKIQFFDRSNGLIALGGTGAVYRTADGGIHWTAVPVPAFASSSVFFSDRLHGWILGTVVSTDQRTFDVHLVSTSDAGDHWVDLPKPPAWQFAGKGGFGTLVFRTPSEGWIGGGTPDLATVYSTVDGGITWQPHALPVTSFIEGLPDGAAAPLLETNVYMLPGSGVLAVAVDQNATPVGLTSFDGGSTWRRLPPPPGETTYSDFNFVDTFHWWAMRFGTLFKSSDAGRTWKEVAQQLDEWDYVPQIVDATHAWAQMTVVFPGANPPHGTGLAFTADGGVHWTPVRVPQPS